MENELKCLKLECTSDIRKDSIDRSLSTLKGRISGQIAPLLPEFPYSSADARFIGNPIDFVVFDGYTQVKDDKGGYDQYRAGGSEEGEGEAHAGRDADQESG